MCIEPTPASDEPDSNVQLKASRPKVSVVANRATISRLLRMAHLL